MELEIDKICHGFKVKKKKNIKEINSEAIVFEHEKSGARLLYLKNDDDNKVFSIGFRTPPKNSTGVPHILEHSVLCGSRKFPIKEPFVELAKGSLNTFLNAMTFSDKTMYPIASKNDKDFKNLMDVYLDAVLYPNIYKYPEILMQEGWHYELESRDAEITYKGVVYNEMKGAFSSPESILVRKIQESLFPDTTYGVESGGDPEDIPNLTQQEFEEFHKKYYHPSNSYIFLYGDMDIEEQLQFINDNYLKDFDKIELDSKIQHQVSFNKMRENVIEYPISANEKEEDKTFLSMNFVVSEAVDAETYLAFEILENLLLETPAAPLKKALIKANICKDVFGLFDNSILQPYFGVIVKNSNEDKKEKFKEIVINTLEELVKNGIDKKLIESAINIKEFQMREADYRGYPKGLIYGIKCMDSWLYDEDPMLHLEYDKILNKIKTALTTNYFEELIKKYILNNSHSSLLILKPKKGLQEEKELALRKELQKYKESLSDSEIDKIIEQSKKLKIRQTTPDSSEQLSKIPLLSLNDIDKKPEELPQIEREEKGIKILFHPMFTSKICYANLYFDTTTVEQRLLPYIGLLSEIIGDISTEKYSYEELSNEVNIHTGGISYKAVAYGEADNDNKFYPKFVVKTKSIVEKIPQLFSLTSEILSRTKYDDKRRLKEIIQQAKSRLEMGIFSSGHIVAARRSFSYFSLKGKYNEIVTGLEFYKFVEDLEKNFEEKSDDIIKNLNIVSKHIFNVNNLIIGVTSSEEDYNVFKDNINLLYDNLSKDNLKNYDYSFELAQENEGLMTSGKVQYVAKAYNFKKLGYSYTGSLQVLKTIESLDYLWNRVRVQGGAYGAFGKFEKDGNMFFGSYRDPNLKETLRVYDEAYEYVKNFNADEREMTKYIIGTISNLDTPLTPAMKGELAVSNHIRNIKYEDIQKERNEVINTSVDDIRKCADLIKDSMKQNYICVLGSEEKIKQNKDLFNKLVNVFE